MIFFNNIFLYSTIVLLIYMVEQDEIIECICCYENKIISIESFTKCNAEPKHLICNSCYTDWGTKKCFFCEPFKNKKYNDEYYDNSFNEQFNEVIEMLRLPNIDIVRNNYRLTNNNDNENTNENRNNTTINNNISEQNVQIIIREPRRRRNQQQEEDCIDYFLSKPYYCTVILIVMIYFFCAAMESNSKSYSNEYNRNITL